MGKGDLIVHKRSCKNLMVTSKFYQNLHQALGIKLYLNSTYQIQTNEQYKKDHQILY